MDLQVSTVLEQRPNYGFKKQTFWYCKKDWDPFQSCYSLICKYISKTIKTKERKSFLEQQMNRNSQDASTKKSEEESVPMSVVEFLDAVEEPLKDQHLPEAKGKDSQDKRSFKVHTA